MIDNCDHCNRNSQAFTWVLEETENFYIVADVHALIEGHILIISKEHISCAGEYSVELFSEFIQLYDKAAGFIKKNYGSISSFEHGKIGQTVFHSHFHLLPFRGIAENIIPEGKSNLSSIQELFKLRRVYSLERHYLFFSIGSGKWVVSSSLAAPGFFRDRFAAALGRPERGNWKEMDGNSGLMKQVEDENEKVKSKWVGHLVHSH